MEKTIAALATPPGVSGLAVIRISGDEARNIIEKIFFRKNNNYMESHKIYVGKIYDDLEFIDQVTVAYFEKPHSYTGEDVIEISCHGGIFVVDRILKLIYSLGAVYPKPGEFTLRAFKNGKMDLTQVEAVGNLINAESPAGSKTAARQLEGSFRKKLKYYKNILLNTASKLELGFDFNEEDIEIITKNEILQGCKEVLGFCESLAGDYKASEILRSGYFIALTGKPNAGKSELFNALLNRRRAIVSSIEGTTRDYLEEKLILNDITVRLFDTAGIRETSDEIEIEGLKMSRSIIEQSDMIILINDITKGLDNSESILKTLNQNYPEKEFLLLHNKADLIESTKDEYSVSAKTGDGVEELKAKIYQTAKLSTERISDILINQRHAELLNKSAEYINNAIQGVEDEVDETIIAFELRKAIGKLEEITGERYNEEILNTIFDGFCIGK
ncbi:MAG: tRNA uridine-5-carboxymethylaminomethyl(34) synthesis GTPase MnmE [bacterium]